MIHSEPVLAAAELGSRPAQKEWSGRQGPAGDNKSPDTGLLRRWPVEGPPLLWSAGNLGDGYSSVSVWDRKIYVTGMKDKRGNLSCLDWDGTLLWTCDYGPEWVGSFPGVRNAPVIYDGFVYVISGQGQVGCYSIETGKERWAADPFAEYEGQMPQWGIAMSPVIVDGKLIYTVGGKKTTVVALDVQKGHVVWASASIGDRTSYCTPAVFQWGGRTILAGMTENHLFAADAKSGDLFWTYPVDSYLTSRNREVHPITPVFHEGALLFTSGYNMGAVKFSLTQDGWTFQREWTCPEFDCHHGSVVYEDGYVYGSNWISNEDGRWACVDWKTGELIYAQRWHNKGSLIWADGLFYAYAEKPGVIGLIRATPKEFTVLSEFPVTLGDGSHWAHPVISGQRFFIRHGTVLMAYDLRAG